MDELDDLAVDLGERRRLGPAVMGSEQAIEVSVVRAIRPLSRSLPFMSVRTRGVAGGVNDSAGGAMARVVLVPTEDWRPAIVAGESPS